MCEVPRRLIDVKIALNRTAIGASIRPILVLYRVTIFVLNCSWDRLGWSFGTPTFIDLPVKSENRFLAFIATVYPGSVFFAIVGDTASTGNSTLRILKFAHPLLALGTRPMFGFPIMLGLRICWKSLIPLMPDIPEHMRIFYHIFGIHFYKIDRQRFRLLFIYGMRHLDLDCQDGFIAHHEHNVRSVRSDKIFDVRRGNLIPDWILNRVTAIFVEIASDFHD